MLLRAYTAATELFAPLLPLHLKRRLRQGKEDPDRLGERYGRPARPRPLGPLLWVHAASVGESLAALPLIDRLCVERPKLKILVTTGTVTSARLMAERLPNGAIHQYAPIDRASSWRRFFTHWRPDLGCLVESEIWPHLIIEAERAALPLVLINGRMSERSAARWRWGGKAATRLFQSFRLCLARSPADGDHFRELGISDVRELGDLKHAAPPLPFKAADLTDLRHRIGDRPVWLAASTHPGEEAILLPVHRRLCERHPDVLTIIAPRHPERGADIQQYLQAEGEAVQRRSLGGWPDRQASLYLADTLGELGLFYRLAKAAFIGGSLVPHGGHNPLEAARLGCPPVFGPHTANFVEMTKSLLKAGAASRIQDADELLLLLSEWLGEPSTLARMAGSALEAGRSEEAVLERALEAMTPLLDQETGLSPDLKPIDACA